MDWQSDSSGKSICLASLRLSVQTPVPPKKKKSILTAGARWCTLIISTWEAGRLEDQKASLGYIMRPSLKKKKKSCHEQLT
jgi:hypothetical protein